MAVAIFIIAMFIYNLFFKSEIISVPDEASATSVGNDLIKLHDGLKGVTFDDTLFSSAGYVLLTDFNVDIPQQPTSRPNPFNTIGQD